MWQPRHYSFFFGGWGMSELSEFPTVQLEDAVDVLDHLRVPVNGADRLGRTGVVPYYGANGLQGWIDKPLFDEPLILLAEDGGNFDDFANRPIAYRIEGPSWINNHAHVIRAKTGICQSFIFWSLVNKDIRRFIAGGTRTKLTQGELRCIEISLPDAKEQQAIAQILDTLDTAIRETDALIDKLKAVKHGLLSDLLTRGIDANGQLRPPQSEAPQLYKESPLGWIPKEWACMEFSALGDYLNGNTFDAAAWKDAGLPIIRIQNLNGSSEFNYYSGAVQEKWHVCPGDLLFAWSGQRGVSFGARLWGGPKGVLNQHIFKVLPKESLISKAFLYRLLRFRQVTIEDAAHGFKDSFLHVTRGELGSVKVGVPSLDEQESIEQRISAFETKFLAEMAEFGKLKSMRSGLMDDLLTGRVRITPLLQGTSC